MVGVRGGLFRVFEREQPNVPRRVSSATQLTRRLAADIPMPVLAG